MTPNNSPSAPSLPRVLLEFVWGTCTTGWHALGRHGRRGLVFFLSTALVLGALARFATPRPPAVAGLPQPVRPITLRIVSDSALTARLQADYRFHMTPYAWCRATAKADLGLADTTGRPMTAPSTRGQPFLSAPVSALAMYLTGTDTVYSTSGRSAVAHEWVHAVDDQVSTRMKHSLDTTITSDEQAALRTAIEGTAVMATRGLAGIPLNDPQTLHTLLGFDTYWDDALVVVAYQFAAPWVQATSHGDLARALDLHPSTMAALFFGRRDTSIIAADTSDERDTAPVQCTDRLGPLGVYLALRHAGAAGDSAWAAASHWLGDRVTVSMIGPSRRTRWDVVFDDSSATRVWNTGPGIRSPLTHARTQTLNRISADVPARNAAAPPRETSGRLK